jgi:hypothetical protein
MAVGEGGGKGISHDAMLARSPRMRQRIEALRHGTFQRMDLREEDGIL